ncbi:MAG TPA: CD1871A family CXXC motif-containing protein [Spirochaetota bacterium]|nr:CD1871A family CXXC motif-containing protein [Spirochaetota bacterium]
MKNIPAIIVIIISLSLIIFGLSFGSVEEGILQKAINICYECIGIG